MVAPLLQHYGVQLWMPEAGGRVDYASEHDERAMTMLGLSSKREVARTSIRVRTAMATQTLEQGRYLGGRPPYGYRLGESPRSWPTRGTPAARCGTGSAPTGTSPTPPMWPLGTGRCSGGTCPKGG
jgi:DNA invertase Pin-like site-specific DNA recombinase